MSEGIIQTVTGGVREAESVADQATVLIHKDNVTPFYFVILVLQTVFDLSYELAEHIAWVAQTTGVAPVLTCPRTDAHERLAEARAAAQRDGFPLIFSLERDVLRESQPDVRKPLAQYLVSLIFLLLALSIAIADGAGGVTF